MQELLCVNCKHCVWIERKADPNISPFCDNPETKVAPFNPGISYLIEISKACPLFEPAEQTERVLVASM
jgi:hypothetical protein